MSPKTKKSSVPLPPSSKENSPPEITVLTRVASIPLISSSLETINGALLNNSYTRTSYSTAKGLSNSAYKLSEPLQIRLAPFIIHANGYANKAVDVVESRYPYPFKAKPEEVASLVRERKQSATDYANKTLDDKVLTPAYTAAQEIDQRFSPIVDYFEVAVTRLDSSGAGPSTPPDAKYQYQRALALSKTLKDNIYVYSNDQLKQIQSQSVLAQRATDTAQSITAIASESITQAQTRIHGLSETLLRELQKLHSSTASISASLQSSVHNSTSQLQSQIPPNIQQKYADLSAGLSSAVVEFRDIVRTKDLPIQEKVSRVGHEVQERVTPLLEAVIKSISELLSRGKTEVADETGHVPNGVNGGQAQPGSD